MVGLLGEKGRGFSEDFAFFSEDAHLTTQALEFLEIVFAQLPGLGFINFVSTYPHPQRVGRHAKITGDLFQTTPAGALKPHSFSFELGWISRSRRRHPDTLLVGIVAKSLCVHSSEAIPYIGFGKQAYNYNLS